MVNLQVADMIVQHHELINSWLCGLLSEIVLLELTGEQEPVWRWMDHKGGVEWCRRGREVVMDSNKYSKFCEEEDAKHWAFLSSGSFQTKSWFIMYNGRIKKILKKKKIFKNPYEILQLEEEKFICINKNF